MKTMETNEIRWNGRMEEAEIEDGLCILVEAYHAETGKGTKTSPKAHLTLKPSGAYDAVQFEAYVEGHRTKFVKEIKFEHNWYFTLKKAFDSAREWLQSETKTELSEKMSHRVNDYEAMMFQRKGVWRKVYYPGINADVFMYQNKTLSVKVTVFEGCLPVLTARAAGWDAVKTVNLEQKATIAGLLDSALATAHAWAGALDGTKITGQEPSAQVLPLENEEPAEAPDTEGGQENEPSDDGQEAVTVYTPDTAGPSRRPVTEETLDAFQAHLQMQADRAMSKPSTGKRHIDARNEGFAQGLATAYEMLCGFRSDGTYMPATVTEQDD